MATHLKVKAHECDICKKKFSTKGNLVSHFRIHLGKINHMVVQFVDNGLLKVLVETSIY